MSNRLICLVVIGCLVAVAHCTAANEFRRSKNSEDLISSIVSNCWNGDAMICIKKRVLDYMNIMAGINEQSARSLNEEDFDKVIFDRAARVLNSNEFLAELPGTAVFTYRADVGLNMKVLENESARGHLLKKKLLLPVILLMKLKMKALMPLIVKIIGLKALKALILSKIAIKLVLGFLFYNIIKKFLGMKMKMMPMMPMMPLEQPMTSYGAPIPTSTSSYEPTGWDSQGGPYARWDSPSPSSSSHSMAYSSYTPSSTYESYKTSSL